jgi:hypothetical protein
MFLHPRCVCSKASLAELERLSARAGSRVQPIVVITRPPGMTGPRGFDAAVAAAGRVPHALVVRDEDGREALRFGARTSGHALLFDEGGRRTYSGGITGSRGHEGDNPSEDALWAKIREPTSREGASEKDDGWRFPIFGCDIFGPGSLFAALGRGE